MNRATLLLLLGLGCIVAAGAQPGPAPTGAGEPVKLDNAKAQARLEALRARLDKADVVVTGAVEKVGEANVVEPISEHAPEWKKATLRGEALKGDLAGSHVDVLFPGSDEPWRVS